MTSTTDNMKKGAARVLTGKPQAVPPGPTATAAPEILRRLDRIDEMLARQEAETAAVRALLDRVEVRWEHTPTFVTRCEEAASRMARLAEQVANGIPTLQGSARRLGDAATELMEHREGRTRRLAVALLLACALPGLLGNLWVAWLAKLL